MHSEFGLLHYLLDSYILAYLPSASVLRSLRTYTKPGYGSWTTPLIAFADPVFSEDESDDVESGFNKRGITRITEISLDQLSQSTGTIKLKRLRQTAAEAMAISDVLGSPKDDIYLRREANEENVYNEKLQRARFVLFSTHGFLGGEFEGMAEPALALSLLGNPEYQDGLLSMSEVLGLDMNAELVALSACNTSGEAERAGQGEGFAGLTRSFMYAGAKSLLVTHWSVESNAARDLMVETFKLMQQEGKPEALRSAKLKMKNSTRTVDGVQLSQSNPYFWSPFVLVGEGGG
jgi:CHAT domain-containing protein